MTQIWENICFKTVTVNQCREHMIDALVYFRL